jgi:hypothetical protein
MTTIVDSTRMTRGLQLLLVEEGEVKSSISSPSSWISAYTAFTLTKEHSDRTCGRYETSQVGLIIWGLERVNDPSAGSESAAWSRAVNDTTHELRLYLKSV